MSPAAQGSSQPLALPSDAVLTSLGFCALVLLDRAIPRLAFQVVGFQNQGSVGVCGRGWLGLGRVCDPGCYTGQSPAIHWMWDFIPSNLSHIPIACELILKRPDSPQPLRMMFLSGLGMIEVLNSSH